MAGLFEKVVNEGYVGGFDSNVSMAIENEVNSRILNVDDASDMLQYTGECMMGMLAVEAVIAQKEGDLAVEYMYKRQMGDTASLEQLVYTFEGFIGDAWEKIKEWIKKAYTAIKNFLIKIWNKIKGYAATVKAFFTKYGDALAQMTITNCKVEWGKIDIVAAKSIYDKRRQEIDNLMNKLRSVAASMNASDENSNAAQWIENVFNPAVSTGEKGMPTAHDIQTDLNTAIYSDPAGYKQKEEDFSAKKADILEAADIDNASKYINQFVGLGDQSMKFDLDMINADKKITETNATNKKVAKYETKLIAARRRCINAKLQLYRMTTAAMTAAAKRKIGLAVAACRKAIQHYYTQGKGATPQATTDSWNASSSGSFDELFASII